jgi:hypothetical protein
VTPTCPVPHCDAKLGTTKRGDPWLMCRKHWSRVPIGDQYQLWRAYRAWQRLERTYLAMPPDKRPPALLDARALAVKRYIEIRDDCIRTAGDGDIQMEVAL